MLLRVSTPDKEGVYQGSKWLKIQALLSEDEMAQMLLSLGEIWIFPLNGMHKADPITQECFLQNYARIVKELQSGKIPSSELLKTVFASVITDDLQNLWLQKVGEDAYLTKMSAPCVILQSHYFTYSSEDVVIRPMSMGEKSIFWGFQALFPQIYQDPKTAQFIDIGPCKLFKTLQRFIRGISKPVAFVSQGKKINTSIRLGNNCFGWINHHPQLRLQQIEVFS